MKRRVIQLISLLIFAVAVDAQSNGIVINGNWSDRVSVSDVNGIPFENKYDNITGSPFFNPVYKFCKIVLTNDRKFIGIQTKINLAAQETVFITANGIEAYMPAGMVKEITYADTSADGVILLYRFQTGFPAVDKQNNNTFYQVLVEGHINLLKLTTKYLTEQKNELSGEIMRLFETYEDYYLFAKDSMKRIKKDKNFILGELADNQEAVADYIRANKLNLKNQAGLVQLFSFYNSL